MKMKMKYTEQAVETLDDAGSVIANKNIEIEQLRQRVAELEILLAEAYADSDEVLRPRVAELEKERDELISKNQNLFNALILSTQKKDSLYASIKAASGHLNLYGLFSCVEGDSYDPECADKNVRKANQILRAELTTEIIKPILKERTDMPIERVQAYEQWGKDMAERDKATQYWQIAEGRCDALIKQRDELVATLETIVKDDSRNPTLMVMIAEEAIASVKEK